MQKNFFQRLEDNFTLFFVVTVSIVMFSFIAMMTIKSLMDLEKMETDYEIYQHLHKKYPNFSHEEIEDIIFKMNEDDGE